MIRIKGIRCKIEENIDIYALAAKKLRVDKEKIKKVTISKKSIDARNKDKFAYVFDLDVLVDNETKYLNKNITLIGSEEYVLPEKGRVKLDSNPVIVGAGPAGLFCAYMLAKNGYKPIVIERGETVEKRVEDVEALWKKNIFKENSNVQFGEGGAGTFSDGKLNTLVKDKVWRMKEVFKTFVECGAPEEIMYEHMPHIGTDVLRNVVINMREKIIEFGGTFKYNALMEDIIIKDGKLEGIVVNGEVIKTNVLVLAIGHSARDTFKMLYDHGIEMTSKPFAVGVRIIHSQELINRNQYPINYSFLPPASYKLTYKSKSGRGVYSFCMCPGGYVVNARSTKSGICVNGMSNYQRDSGFANSAIVVTVDNHDYGDGVLDGMYFQEKLEKKAYEVGNGVIPVQKYGDYKNNTLTSVALPDSFKGLTSVSNINQIFPSSVNTTLKEGIDYFQTKIEDFNSDAAIIAAPEARTSSPVRIIRSGDGEANILGIYPCGEGAGYAGGITTSAIDGIKVFENIYQKYYIKK